MGPDLTPVRITTISQSATEEPGAESDLSFYSIARKITKKIEKTNEN